nr:MAG TPA: hypothetical protein [Bacteriophage sp.]
MRININNRRVAFLRTPIFCAINIYVAKNG